MKHIGLFSDKYATAYGRYKDGLSLDEVAKEMGVTRQCVFKAFKARKFILRAVNRNPHQVFNGLKLTLRNHGYFELTTGERTLMHRYVWLFHNGPIPDDYDIHHLDENKRNNDINNLECLPKSEHTRKYSPHNNQFTRGRARCR